MSPLTATHRANRHRVVTDMATWLTTQAAEQDPEATPAEAVATALDTARRLAPEAWLTLGQETGHYRLGDTPDPATCDAVVRDLTRAAAAAATPAGDPFAGLPV